MISCSATNELTIDLDALFGDPGTLALDPWDRGFSWQVQRPGEDEEFSLFDPAAVPLFLVAREPAAAPWLARIPAQLLPGLLDFERSCREMVFPAMWFLSRYPRAVELFQSAPLLVALLIHCARVGDWPMDTVVDLFSARRTRILDVCGLDGTRANLRLLGKLRCERFGHAEYRLLQRSRNLPGYEGLGHLRALDFRVLAFFLEHPAYATGRLFRGYDHDWPWAEFSRTRADITNMAGILGLGDMDDRMAACRDMDQLVRLHDRLVIRLNREKAKRIELIAFPEPPDPGNEHIKPIRDSRELACEGMSQHHCVASYHQRILAGRYYVYSVTAPERATLGVKLAANGEMTMDQLKLRYNGQPSAETRAMVAGWLAEAFRRSDCLPADDG